MFVRSQDEQELREILERIEMYAEDLDSGVKPEYQFSLYELGLISQALRAKLWEEET